jgi:act minimal PKS acyl carrier protein
MQGLTLDELLTITKQAAGEWNRVDEGVDIAGVPYTELGYDSLALLEVLTRIERTLQVKIPEATVIDTATPGETLAAVNAFVANLAAVS